MVLFTSTSYFLQWHTKLSMVDEASSVSRLDIVAPRGVVIIMQIFK